MSRVCPSCGNEVPDVGQFCARCGAQVPPAKRRCRECDGKGQHPRYGVFAGAVLLVLFLVSSLFGAGMYILAFTAGGVIWWARALLLTAVSVACWVGMRAKVTCKACAGTGSIPV